MKYPKNQSIAKYVDYATDKKINDTMSAAVKESASKIAAYLDFIAGYWPDYEKHVSETTVTASDLEAVNPAEWNSLAPEIQRKMLKAAENEKKQRLRTIAEMRSFLNRQQETMQKFSPEAAAKMEEIQDSIAA